MSNGYTLNPDGTIVFELDGVLRTLRRPKLREYREVIESLGEFRDEVLAATEAAKAAMEAGKPVPNSDTLKIGAQLEKLLTWLDGVFTKLAGEGFPRDENGAIDEDKLEPWILSGQVVADMIAHWQTVPSRHGGQ